MSSANLTRHIEITVSLPYVKIAGGWTTMRPVGLRVTYTAVVDGAKFQAESKSEIQTNIRHALYRAGHRGPVKFTVKRPSVEAVAGQLDAIARDDRS